MGRGCKPKALTYYQSRSIIFLGGMVTTSERKKPLWCKTRFRTTHNGIAEANIHL